MGNLGATVDEISWVATSYIIANVIVIPMTSWLAGPLRTAPLLRRLDHPLHRRRRSSAARRARCPQLVGVPRRAGHGRRRAARGGAVADGRDLPGAAAGHRTGDLRRRRDARPEPRPHARRLDHRRVGLALDLLGERAARDRRGDPVLAHAAAHAAGTCCAASRASTGRGSRCSSSASRRSRRCSSAATASTGSRATSSTALARRSRRSRSAASSGTSSRRPHPVVDLRVFRNRSLVVGCTYGTAIGIGLYGCIFLFPLFTQDVLHWTSWQSGLGVLPSSIATATMMPIVGPTLWRVGPAPIFAAGLASSCRRSGA